MKNNHLSIFAALITVLIVSCNAKNETNGYEREDGVVAAEELLDLSIKINPTKLTYQENDSIKIEVDLYSQLKQLDNNEYQTTYSFEKPIDLKYWHVDSTRWFQIATSNQILIPEGLRKGSYQIFINCEVHSDAGANTNFECTLHIE